MGAVVKTHGVHGFLRVKSYSGETDHLTRLRQVKVGDSRSMREYEVEAVRTAGRDILMKLSGVDSPEEGVLLRGADLWVDRSEACPLNDGEYYVADLCGCAVFQSGAQVGTVRSIVESGAADLIEITALGGREFFVPFVDEYVGEIDLAQRSICLKEGYELA